VNVDLHTHTTASDGSLSPAQLVDAACAAGVQLLSITDHDTMDAYSQLGPQSSLQIVPGVEFSSRWQRLGVHVVGLNLEPECARVREAVRAQGDARAARAEAIAHALRELEIPDLLEAARACAGGGVPGRPHFATVLVQHGKVRDTKHAFKRYLGAGKPGDVLVAWKELECVVGWIREAGGIAVLAHPGKYGLTRAKLRRLCAAFCDAGGQAMEVISGAQDPALTSWLGEMSTRRGLLASVGSDFHRPDQSWGRLGNCPPLPEGCRPVWEAF